MTPIRRPFIAAALLIACGAVLTSPATAQFSESIRAVAVGHEDYVWAVDGADATRLYRRDPITHRTATITSNIEVDALDVSLDGVVLALSGEKLYVWDEATSTFDPHPSSIELDQVAIADEDLELLVTPNGTPVFITNKRDRTTHHSDRDPYQHTLSMESPRRYYVDPAASDRPARRGQSYEIDPLALLRTFRSSAPPPVHPDDFNRRHARRGRKSVYPPADAVPRASWGEG